MTSSAVLDDLLAMVRSVGSSQDDQPNGYAVDFHSVILGDPFLAGTGYLPDRATAEGFAALVLPILESTAQLAAAEDPSLDLDSHVTDRDYPDAWCYIVSAKRDTDAGDPLVEQMYEGDAWFVVGVAIGTLTDDEVAKLEKVRTALAMSSRTDPS